MEAGPRISLLDLSRQFRFEIDDEIKEKLCFGESLLISCGHFEGDVSHESGSEFSCSSSETDVELDKTSVKKVHEYAKKENFDVKSDTKSESEEENDFHMFFFPDCSKPLAPTNSKASVLIGLDGMPQINKVDLSRAVCTCEQDKNKECKCFTKVPCLCRVEIVEECTCGHLKEVCFCAGDEESPQLECECKPSKTCICENKVKLVCTCDASKPCTCQPVAAPYAVCTCKSKPNMPQQDDDQSYASFEGSEPEYETPKLQDVPCDCQTNEPKPCVCLQDNKKKYCTCKPCVCAAMAGPSEIVTVQQTDNTPKQQPAATHCTCDAGEDGVCECFDRAEPPPSHCTCDDPDNCKCFEVCECPDPCVCDMQPKEPKGKPCTCKETGFPGCICHPKFIEDVSPLKFKKKRVGKHEYKWCHDVDARHTYFDYAYDRHDKIADEVEHREKVKILGSEGDKAEADSNVVTVEIEAPKYKKNVRQRSIDCCSTLGGMSINVECLGESKDKFLVQVTSHYSKEGAKAGMKLVSIIDCHLHTMEENRTEHLTKRDIIKERKSYMAICDSGYYNKITRVCGERHVVKRMYHSFEDAHNFLLEGANVVLLRYFALSRYRGRIKTDTVKINGLVCESIYVCYGVTQAIVNGKSMFVCKVERHIIEASGLLHQTMTVLSLRGYLICHEWAHNNYIIHINPLLKVTPEKDLIEEHVPLRKRWREDLQLLSDYLDFKSTRSSEGARYTSESTALTNSVRDYLQALLMLRPHDALHFTRHFFASTLSSLDLPHSDYFEPRTKHVTLFFFED